MSHHVINLQFDPVWSALEEDVVLDDGVCLPTDARSGVVG